MARHAVPTIEFDISRSGGIRVQDPVDDGEEVVQATFFDRRSDRSSPFTGAERVIADVGMRCIRRRRGWVWIERHDRIRSGASEFVELEANHEPAELDPLEFEGFGSHAERVVIRFQVFEIATDRHKFFVEHANRWRCSLTSVAECSGQFAQGVTNVLELGYDGLSFAVCRMPPSARFGDGQSLKLLPCVLPTRFGQWLMTRSGFVRAIRLLEPNRKSP